MKQGKPLHLLGLVLLSLLLAGCHQGLLVKVKTGWVKGIWADDAKNTTREFLGIPYAKPPVGNLRFAAPQPALKWKGVLDASAFGPSCFQPQSELAATNEQSEDCLTLNVYAPPATPPTGVPVMVFIHGGAFVSGGSSQYDAKALSQQGNVIVVTLNYRLGALGFFSSELLDQDPSQPASGNAGLLDQQLAMKWVKDNIRAFGGNPDNVTLFGESAGSASVCAQMVAPGSHDLAKRYIMESGVCTGGLPPMTQDQAHAMSDQMAADLCPDAADKIACLRQTDPATLVNWDGIKGMFGTAWGPAIIPGSTTLPASPKDLIASGQFNHGQVILGTNKNEWGLFQLINVAPTVSTVDQLSALIDTDFGAAAPILKPEYLPTNDADANQALIRLYTDAVFRCPTRSLARMLQEQGDPVWLYSFEQGAAFHAMELPYVFGFPNPILAPTLVEPLRVTMEDYWTHYAATGNPNLSGQPEWPAYDAASDQHMVLQENSQAGVNLEKSACDLWDTLSSGS